ncbi:MAG: hypothetical protein QNJ44_08860 [Rhodobacter sp.]|nr:hypothetical protein [Rhodobacter sp.]
MTEFVAVAGIQDYLALKIRKPTTIWWNRLEGEPRARDFTRALKAEVRDPLWLLTRQWQMGEFLADDAGSPVSAKLAWTTERVAAYSDLDGAPRPYTGDLPLEAVIEARSAAEVLAGRPANAALRLALGRRWEKLLQAGGHGARIGDFRTTYAFVAPDPVAKADFDVTAHPATWQMLAAVAGRAVDGGTLLAHLATAGALASDGLGLAGPEKDAIDTLGDQFRTWAESRYLGPDETLETWLPRNLEYRARLSVPDGAAAAALAAPDHRGGRMDWFSFDAVSPGDGDGPGADPPLEVTSFMPATASFDGMPNTRHWTFEEGRVSFGAIRPDTTDLAKLLLIEFGLVFANDWFLVPLDLPTGSLTGIRGLAVTNVFGERRWVEPAVTRDGPTDSWQIFRFTDKGRAEDRLFLPATTPAPLESRPVEAVAFIRDEVANMVWGIETTVPLADGGGYPGRETALETHRRHQGSVAAAAAPPATDANVKYTLMTTPAEHWIPFVPVHVPGDTREVQLQRSALPRLLEGATGAPEKIEPRTALLREGLDAVPQRAYFIAEEEVERAGRSVELVWQRCRWTRGRVVTWLGHKVKTGRGEGSGGLAFDILEPNSR